MNKLYRSNVACAKPNFYEAAKPKFCASCGQPFSSGFSAIATTSVQVSSQPKQTLTPRINIIEEPQIDFSNFKLNVKDLGKKVTLGEIQSNANLISETDRPVGNQTDADTVLRDNIRRAKQVNREEDAE